MEKLVAVIKVKVQGGPWFPEVTEKDIIEWNDEGLPEDSFRNAVMSHYMRTVPAVCKKMLETKLIEVMNITFEKREDRSGWGEVCSRNG